MKRFELFNLLMRTEDFVPLRSDDEFSLLSPDQERAFVEKCSTPPGEYVWAALSVLADYARKGVGR